MMRRWAAALLALAALPAAEVKHRLPALSAVFPQGARPGSRLTLDILGEYLDRPGAIVFPDGFAEARILSGSHTRLSAEIAVAGNAAYGPHYFRVVTPRGASNLLLFRVGDQPHLNEREPNTALDEAQQVSLPATINGRLERDGDFDFFRFRAKQGESWIFDLRSARNGSGLDAALILLDAQGRKLAHSEDVFLWDPFLHHTFRSAGDYIAVVQPTHARNDPGFAYQLDIRQSPHLETISPLSLRPGETVEARLFGVGLVDRASTVWFNAPGFRGEVREMRGADALVRIAAPAHARDGPHELVLVSAASGRSNAAAFLIDSTPRHPGGSRLALPASINAIARYREPERYTFQVKEGEMLAFEVRAQRYGSPVDSLLRILDAAGREIASNDDATFPGEAFNKDSRIAHRFRDAGDYQIEIRNLWKTTGENFPYQLLATRARPEFDLTLATDNPYVYEDGAPAILKTTLTRRDGHEGDVAPELAGLPVGVVAERVGDTEFRLTAKGAKAGSHGQVRVTAPGHQAWRSARIAGGGGEGATFARVNQATLGVAERPLFSLEAAVTNVPLVRGGAAEFAVAITRADAFRDPIAFRAENLPAGVEMAEAVVAAAGAVEVRIRLKASPTMAPGRFTRIAILGEAPGGHVQEAPRIGLSVD